MSELVTIGIALGGGVIAIGSAMAVVSILRLLDWFMARNDEE